LDALEKTEGSKNYFITTGPVRKLRVDRIRPWLRWRHLRHHVQELLGAVERRGQWSRSRCTGQGWVYWDVRFWDTISMSKAI